MGSGGPSPRFPISREAARAAREGLYEPASERDGCGVGFVASMSGRETREVLDRTLLALRNLSHRGAVASDPLTGDGCGVLASIPDRFFREHAGLAFSLPPPGGYALGQLFLSRDERTFAAELAAIEEELEQAGLALLGRRTVPVDPGQCGVEGRRSLPRIVQAFIAPAAIAEEDELERALFVVRKRLAQRVAGLYACSLSTRTVVYKGLLLPDRLADFYPDLRDPRFAPAIAVFHQRFSTNTFPSWARAHPYRFIAHNGEINTLRGNLNWMRAREADLRPHFPGLARLIDTEGSDSAMLDNALELLVRGGRSLPHALMMCIPEAWERHASLTRAARGFYAYHACLMEPWDGPALVAFTDGRVVGGRLDRSGLRPARYAVTRDGLLAMSSEAGAFELPEERIVESGRLEPGAMLLLDTESRRIVPTGELIETAEHRAHYAEWAAANVIELASLAPATEEPAREPLRGQLLQLAQRAHAYTREDLHVLLAPMANAGQEPLGAMGDDGALAVLSERAQLLFDYFKQLFAQVTNPPLDPIRESLVMSLRTLLGKRGHLLATAPEPFLQLELDGPVLLDEELDRIEALGRERGLLATLECTFEAVEGGLRPALDALRSRAVNAIEAGASVLLLSDRGCAAPRAPMPSLLAVAAVHHHLIRAGLRQRASIVVESAEIREVMHLCLAIGYGASAVCPYLATSSIAALAAEGRLEVTDLRAAQENYRAALHQGLLKVLSKMGISTVQSYQGAQTFEALGLGPRLIEEFFPGTSSRIGGIELEVVEAESLMRHRDAERPPPDGGAELGHGGRYKWRRDGVRHQLTPNAIGLMQHAVRSASFETFRKYSRIVDAHTTRRCDIRGLLEFVTGPPIPIEEVEPAADIVKRFRTGAMSFGSLSGEAHETLAIAMNSLGARSNSGEGGEDPRRYAAGGRSNPLNSAIKQVASGRFGVTPAYLLSASELQIKIAQGAKPGEGGHLPGHKVDATIARVRHATPGVGLISPPPHHDIYSIEDLAQLVFDLKNANPAAEVSVKLVSEVGVGTVAAGVAKAKADHIVISGHSGGTGASPLSSIVHAGLPWELGIAEAQQVLMLNGLRDRVSLEVDGQLKTGRDVAIAALLGAESFGFGTAALIASGCILMRVCHKNTCPVGIATQDPVLRKRFAGLPDHVVNFMLFVAEELRLAMAKLGVRSVGEMIGRTDLLRVRADVASHWKARHLELSRLLHRPRPGSPRSKLRAQSHGLEQALDRRLIAEAEPALARGERVEIEAAVRSTDRSVGVLLSSEVVRAHGAKGLAEGTIGLRCRGSAGQSFAAFLAPGVDVSLLGAANDGLGKGMAGGRIAVRAAHPGPDSGVEQVLAGNVTLYGATAGRLFVRGRAGERFAVRNSGALAVVEGVGDHACEYMTGGTVVVLGATGRNFAAGMSGGVAYVLDVDGSFRSRCNRDLVDVGPADEAGWACVRALLREHFALTRSPAAWRVLLAWRRHRHRFLQVMPHEYRRALQASQPVVALAAAG